MSVGAPYFNRFFIPVGLALLFLMAVAPALPWRKTTVEVMRGRLAVPAAVGVLVVVVCVLAGIHGIEPLLAFGLGGFAGASAGAGPGPVGPGRLPRRPEPVGPPGAGGAGRMAGPGGSGQRRHGGPHRGGGHRRRAGRRHLLPPPRGAHLSRGQSATFAGHTVTFVGTRQVTVPSHSAFEAVLRVDHGRFYPAISQFGSGTCGGHAGHRLQLEGRPLPDHRPIPSKGAAGPSAWWNSPWWPGCGWGRSWSAVGSILSAIPGRRRRPTDPVSAPVVSTAAPRPPTAGANHSREADLRPEPEADPLPVGAGDPT